MKLRPLVLTVLALTFVSTAAAAEPDVLELHPKDLVGRDLPALQREAQKAYLEHRYADAARLWVRIVRIDPANAASLYNLGCMYARLGRAQQSAEFVYEAWHAGLRDLDMIRKDPDLEGVRKSAPFVTLMHQLESEATSEPRTIGTPLDLVVKSAATVRVVTPAKMEPGRRYPLVVALHGMGGTAELFARLLLEGEAGPDAIWAFPQAPYAVRVAGGVGYSWFRLDEGRDPDPRTRDLSEDYVLDVVRTMIGAGTVDPARVYVVGFSQGAFLTYDLALHHPEVFRGAVPISGWIQETRLTALPEATKKLRILILHSKNDPAVPWRDAKAAAAFLDAHGVSHRLDTFEGGHAVPPAVAAKVQGFLKEDLARK